MVAYRRVYDSRHLLADCQEPGSAPEPYARQSGMGYLYLFSVCTVFCCLSFFIAHATSPIACSLSLVVNCNLSDSRINSLNELRQFPRQVVVCVMSDFVVVVVVVVVVVSQFVVVDDDMTVT